MDPPALDIPKSTHTVSVSVIDSTSDIIVPNAFFLQPQVPGFETMRARSVFFLIECPSDNGGPPRRILFDLGTRADWATGLSPATLASLQPMTTLKTSTGEPAGEITVEKDAHTILKEGCLEPDSIEAIIWSHAHVDHTGNPALFGQNTGLVIGPGFGSCTCNSGPGSDDHDHEKTDQALQPHIFPGYPADPESLLLESDYKGRNLRELTSAEFDRAGITIAGLRALDYFGDGSFYLLDTPGHSPGHLCGLARVQEDHFILMLGDGIHHMAELRPNPYKPLPQKYVDSKLLSHFPEGAPDKALFRPAGPKGASMHLDPDQAAVIIAKLQVLDAHSNVFAVAAHDGHVFAALVDAHKDGEPALFPSGTVNDFVARGYVEKTQWTFLKDFAHLV
ncbi:hypothetical protein SEUCBS140593_005878 [Sporothrix eucalyptigena]|uniref:Metallo-beta-lactamase domain-containing protein n=1 Tax=Sporothrix eucalyptigena TaxID=1812306 RepID=A0ABP0C132_9PEZI